MTKNKTSDSQLKANQKWNSNNKEKMNYIRKRSAARGFVKVATTEDLQELESLIYERKNMIEKKKE
ncbi:hypothetical protein ACFFIF_00615 [Vagococcus entomophilus]|uniref:Uncharacterized protein n=1 Tax=Vagococcus entomophilus TaxID=1160095 RepID=A0A430AKS5_9ENTE|nr:hypothetical protein [Vagococcus entomophilus]RSU08669.1 hypothetical protein CBF30_05435 [Vagococcus entomophilus]